MNNKKDVKTLVLAILGGSAVVIGLTLEGFLLGLAYSNVTKQDI